MSSWTHLREYDRYRPRWWIVVGRGAQGKGRGGLSRDWSIAVVPCLHRIFSRIFAATAKLTLPSCANSCISRVKQWYGVKWGKLPLPCGYFKQHRTQRSSSLKLLCHQRTGKKRVEVIVAKRWLPKSWLPPSETANFPFVQLKFWQWCILSDKPWIMAQKVRALPSLTLSYSALIGNMSRGTVHVCNWNNMQTLLN